MSLAIALMIVSGVAGVMLTVWGRIVPPKNPATRSSFVFVGAVGVLCIIAAGVLNSRSQESLNGTIKKMADDVGKLADLAQVNPNQSTDHILAAAASKLISQQGQINHLTADLERVTAQQREDHSVKMRLRNLLSGVDSRIPTLIDAGQAKLTVRMQVHDVDALEKLLSEPDAGQLLSILDVSPVNESTINNGSLGTIVAGPQRTMVIEASPALRQ